MIRELFTQDLSLWTCLWQSTAFAALGVIAGWLLRRRPSRAYQVLLLAMMAAVAVPLSSAVVKHFDLGAFVATETELPRMLPEMSLDAFAPAPETAVMDAAPAESIIIEATEPASFSIPWRMVMLYGWMAATLVLLGRLAVTFLYGVHLVRHASRTWCEPVQQASDRARSRLGMACGLEVRASGRIRSPIVWCWSHVPILLVPDHCEDRTLDWTGVVAHELAHCRRRDHVTGLLAEVAASLLPWNPLMWVSKRYLVRLGEQACDDWVVAAGEDSGDYAESLLRFRPQRQMAFLPAVVHSKKGLAARVRRILTDTCSDPRTGTKWALAVSSLAICVGLAVAFAQARPAPTAAPAEQANMSAKSLHQAAAAGDVEEVKRLIAQGADVNAKGEKGQTVLHYAVENGHREVAELLIAQGADVNAGGYGDGTPLLTAIFGDDVDLVRLLVDKGADCNVYDQRGQTPLIYAITALGEKDKEIVELLISGGAKIYLEDKQGGRTPLHCAAFGGSKRVFEVFLAKVTDPNTIHLAALKGDVARVKTFVQGGIDVNTKDKCGCTPLHWAAPANTNDVADFLIAKGADVNAKDNNGSTPLLGARRLDMVRFLVSKGADVNVKGALGYTKLHGACFVNDIDMAAFLISKGANVNAKNNWGMTPLLLASASGHRELVELLIASGADVNMRYWNGTPLLAAVAEGHTEVVKLLIAKGADINASDNQGRTPLSRAKKEKHPEVVSILRQNGARDTLHGAVAAEDVDEVKRCIAQGVDVNTRDERGGTPLHVASRNGQVNMARFLTAEGADVNLRDPRGTTALWMAARRGHREVVEFLIEKGADINASNNQGVTPLAIAKQQKHTEIVELLQKHGAQDDSDAAPEESKPAKSLHEAAAEGDSQQVKALIAEGVNVNGGDGRDNPPLCRAVKAGSMDVVKLLVEAGADVNAGNWPPLCVAVDEDNVPIAKYLIEKGANIDIPEGWTALQQAPYANASSLEMIKLLIAKGGDVNAGPYTALHGAVDKNRLDMIELLLEKGADINAIGKRGMTPLCLAARYCTPKTIGLLIARGANPNIADEGGFLPLHWAAVNGDKDMLDLLLSKGDYANSIHVAAYKGNLNQVTSRMEDGTGVNVKGEAGWTPLHWAGLANSSEMAAFLITKGADVNARAGHGFTPLRTAHSLPVIKLLISRGADVKAEDTDLGLTKLHMVCGSGDIDVAELLIASGADVNAKPAKGGMYGRTPLHFAAIYGHRDIASLLISKGADIHAVCPWGSDHGQTALHLAARTGQVEVVEYLLAEGLDVNVRDSKGQTALDLAKKQNHTEVIELLRKHGAKE